jgi:hypothetical protein
MYSVHFVRSVVRSTVRSFFRFKHVDTYYIRSLRTVCPTIATTIFNYFFVHVFASRFLLFFSSWYTKHSVCPHRNTVRYIATCNCSTTLNILCEFINGINDIKVKSSLPSVCISFILNSTS